MTVTAYYPGANAKTIAETVATPIEQQIIGVEGMMYMSSQCTNALHGPDRDRSTRHEYGYRPGAGAKPRGDRAAAFAGGSAAEGIVVKKASPNITLGIAVFSPDGSRDPLYVSNYVTLQVKDELARLPGVGDLSSSAHATTRCGCG